MWMHLLDRDEATKLFGSLLGRKVDAGHAA
jgi:hypothetical protein